MLGKVLGVSISKERGTRKYNVKKCKVTNNGLEGDAHAGNWDRQVSILAIESVRKHLPKLNNIEFGFLSENIMIEGLEIHTLPIGTKLKLGEEVIVKITQIGKDPSEFTEEEYENILRDYLSDSMEIIRITNNPFNRKIPARIDILQDKEEKEEIPEIIDNAVEEITE